MDYTKEQTAAKYPKAEGVTNRHIEQTIEYHAQFYFYNANPVRIDEHVFAHLEDMLLAFGIERRRRTHADRATDGTHTLRLTAYGARQALIELPPGEQPDHAWLNRTRPVIGTGFREARSSNGWLGGR